MNSTEILQNLEKPKDNIIKTIQNIHDLRAGKYWRLRNPIIICAYYALGKTSFANRYWREFVVEDADAGKYAEIRDSSDHYIHIIILIGSIILFMKINMENLLM